MFALCIESSHARGLGHLYRSLTLASALREHGCDVRFLLNDHRLSVELLRDRGYEASVVDLASDRGWEQDWLDAHPHVRVWVNDRLNTDRAHAFRVKRAGVQLATFDDRGSGAALSDLHVAALAFDDADELQGKHLLSGVDYLLLDPALASRRRLRTEERHVLLTMGGSDTWGVTPRVMNYLLERGRGATVVLGPAFEHGRAVDEVLARAPEGLFMVHRQGVPSLANEMARQDLAITGGGMTPFEASAVGLPCIVIASESFEIPVGRELERLGGCVFAGFYSEMDWSVLERVLPVAEMSRAGMEAMDLEGLKRVTNALIRLAEAAE